MALEIRSTAFREGGEIPVRHTCEGDDLSPPLSFSGVPDGTRTLALVVDDPDAPDPAAPRMRWVHWVLYGMPASTRALAEGIRRDALPGGTMEGMNDWKRAGYGGPCPPVGRHRYFFKLYALDIALPDLGTPTRAKLLEAMKGHVVAEAQLVGTYEKKRRR